MMKGREHRTSAERVCVLKRLAGALPLLLVLGVLGPAQMARGEAGLSDILFRATFDGTVEPEIHQHAPGVATEGVATYRAGVFGQALVVGETHAVASYKTDNNIDTRQGSLSLRLCAVDWNPAEERSHLFVHLADGGIFRLYSDEAGELVFELGPDLTATCRVRAPLAGIRQGAWMHVVATWSRDELRLFVNGELADTEPVEPEHLTYVVSSRIEVGDQPRARGREAPRTTLIDDLTIYRRPLDADELGRVHRAVTADAASPYEPPLVTVPRAAGHGRPDGRLTPEAWRRAAKFGSFVEVGGDAPAAFATTAMAAYDDEFLYLTVHSPVLAGVPLRAQQAYRDDPVWTDDAVQFYISPANSGYRYAIIINAKGVVYDRREHMGLDANTAWNGDYRLHNHVDDRGWTLQLAIPFQTLETASPEPGETWRFNVTRDRVEPQSLSSWAKVAAYSDWDKHGFLRFAETGRAVRLERVTAGRGGQVRVEGEVIAGERPGDATVLVTASHQGTVLFQTEEAYALAAQEVRPIQIEGPVDGTNPDRLDTVVMDGGEVIHRATAFLGASSSSLKLTAHPKPSEGVCRVSLLTDRGAAGDTGTSAVITLLADETGEPARVVRIEPLTDGKGGGQFALDGLAAGDYTLHAELRVDGRPVDQISVAFVKPVEPWRDLRLGVSDVPPPPWEPIVVDDTRGDALRIDCWNRRHRFDGSVLPAQITSGGVDQLTSPARIELRAGGEPVRWTRRSLRLTDSSATRVDYASRMESSQFRVIGRASMEFDGMMWHEITIEAQPGATVDALDLVIPLDARYTTLRHVPFDVAETGALGREEGWSWMSKLPKGYFMWLGGNDRGLTWFYERLEQYDHADPEKAVSLTRRGDTLEFRVHYVGKPTELREPLTLAFGLQATPVKPRPPGWRSWGAPRPIGDGISIMWTGEEVHRYGTGYAEALNPEAHRRRVRHEQSRGYRVAPYIGLNFQAVNSPEWRYNQEEWALGSGTIKYHDHRPFWWGAYTDNSAESFADYITWKIREYVQDQHLDGVYHDLQWSYRTRRGERTFRGDRAVNMRLYTTLKQLDRPVIKIDHASAALCSVYHGFSDLFIVGEEFRLHPPTPTRPDPPDHHVWGDYFDHMRLDYFRASGATGRQWGTTPMFLLQMTAPSQHATEGIYAILLAHDAIPTWDALARDVRFQYRVWRMLEAFGIGEPAIRFLPYWHADNPAQVTDFAPVGGGAVRPVRVVQDIYTSHPEYEPRPEDAYGASVYRLGDQRSLVVVFNFTEDDAAAQLTLDLPALGLDPQTAVATDAYTRLTWTAADRPLRLNVRKRNCRVIWVEERDAAGVSSAALTDHFPDEMSEAVVAGSQPEPPAPDGSVAHLLAGDTTRNPWEDQQRYPSAYLRTEVAQVFRLAQAARVHRFEVCLANSPGPRINRLPITARLVRATSEGLPMDDVIAGPPDFAPDRWIPSDPAWQLERFELERAVELPAGDYALVLCKPLQFPQEHFHVRLPARPAESADHHVAVRLLDEEGRVLEDWQSSPQTLTYGVFGHLSP